MARALAEKLLRQFVEPPATIGLRIPTFFGPDNGDSLPPPLRGPQSLDLDVAEHTIVVLLADQQMVRQVAAEDTGEQWREFARKLTSRTKSKKCQHHVFAVALDAHGFDLLPGRHIVKAFDESWAGQVNEISLQISICAIQLLRDGYLNIEDSRGLKAPMTLFLSHAKADLKSEPKDPVRYLIYEGAELPVKHWFDSAEIGPNETFADRINQGIRDSAVVVVFLTDQYASRPWCRHEVVEAKRMGLPIVVVDALSEGEPRNFPYLGNVPTIRWNDCDTSEPSCRTQARRVIDRAIRESLRTLHNLKITTRAAAKGEVPLATSPEAASLASDPVKSKLKSAKKREVVFVYPDPPMSSEELDILNVLSPRANFTTPISKLAAQRLSKNSRHIGVSISEVSPEELRKHGLSQSHYLLMTDELHLYLLLAGAQIGYGGALKGSMMDANNFTLRLFELVRGYSSLAHAAVKSKLLPIINYAPWPLHLDYSQTELNRMTGVAKYLPGKRPEISERDDQLFPARLDGKWRFVSNSQLQRYAWSRGLTEMRQAMTEATSARVVCGGKLTGFSGHVSGVLEEAWMSIKAHKPLFIVGAFGGVAGAIVDILEGRMRGELTDKFARLNIPDFAAVQDLFARDKIPFVTSEQMVADIQKLVKSNCISGTLRNGLDDEQNQELFRIVDPARAAELILAGLNQIH